MERENKSNFHFLQPEHGLFFQLANSAEIAFSFDPNTTLLKVRQLGEALAQEIAARWGLIFQQQPTQLELLNRLNNEGAFDKDILELFHLLRKEGNRANHQFITNHREALQGLKVARELSYWFYIAFCQGKEKLGPFTTPPDPSIKAQQLQDQVNELRAQMLLNNSQDNDQLLRLERAEKEEWEQLCQQMSDESAALFEKNKLLEQQLQKEQCDFQSHLNQLRAKLTEMQNTNQNALNQQRTRLGQQGRLAAKAIWESEELTRILIDQQLRDAGWQVDSKVLRYSKGTRPQKGLNIAIAEWPCKSNGENGIADYVLFNGLMPVAAVEAKKGNMDVSGKIIQAQRYSRGIQMTDGMIPPYSIEQRTQAWPNDSGGYFQLPFVYSCNGRPYHKQLAEQSGIWFRDVRKPANIRRALPEFHSPDGLNELLIRAKLYDQWQLKNEGFDYLKLRDYQIKAIQAVEASIDNNQRQCLLAMATGTGKTRTILGLMYRFLKAEKFRRILFLVDRKALGEQAEGVFDEAILEQNMPLSKIYNISKLGDMAAQAETRVQVATVQAMVKRLFYAENPPTIDTYDCIIVDEAHRGYTLDQEMTEGELDTRDISQYLSTYRKVLDYFDAIKIGLTATPAKHTIDIFGWPVYTYSYREAVADDWLIDHEPPIRYKTLLNQNGIHFDKGDEVESININTGEVNIAELDDELDFSIESFNRTVINENFDRVICQQLAKEIDPLGEAKTLIFCTTDKHADRVKRLLDDVFSEIYEDSYNEAAVQKITGQTPNVDSMIRQYKNERCPNIAITVDLLTTCIDVPQISHLVFMRRVRSRILYEQMKGRATRRCDEIGKTTFRIYDPVDIYQILQPVDTMKPLVKNPNIPLEQLIGELSDPDWLKMALQSKGDDEVADTQADVVLNDINQKIMSILRKAAHKAERNSLIKDKLEQLQQSWGLPPQTLHQHLHKIGPQKAAEFLQQHHNLIAELERIKILMGTERQPIISHHQDEFHAREQNYGYHSKPEDYLDSFNEFIRQQVNLSAALSVVVNRPRDLTRESLKEVRMLLDNKGYNEATLDTAWRSKTNQNIAASIIGYIRQAALGEALIPFEDRINRAMQTIYRSRNWTSVQREWLDRLAKQLKYELIINRDVINSLPAFTTQGGAKRIDRILDNQLDTIIEELNNHLWASYQVA